MLCANPTRLKNGAFPCGVCLCCRQNQRYMWASRLVLELQSHNHACFVTLTYADPAPESVNPDHLQAFMKALRKRLDYPIRFYGVGEYGERTSRAHYHVALFGLGLLEAQEVIPKVWSYGFIHVGEMNEKTASYIAGYVSKKMNKADDPRLEGRHPEFVRMSLKPGIGALTVDAWSNQLTSEYPSRAVASRPDVPRLFRAGGRARTLGKYLRGRLREGIGWDRKTPDCVLEASAEVYQGLTEDELGRIEVKRSADLQRALSLQAAQRAKRNSQ